MGTPMYSGATYGVAKKLANKTSDYNLGSSKVQMYDNYVDVKYEENENVDNTNNNKFPETYITVAPEKKEQNIIEKNIGKLDNDSLFYFGTAASGFVTDLSLATFVTDSDAKSRIKFISDTASAFAFKGASGGSFFEGAAKKTTTNLIDPSKKEYRDLFRTKEVKGGRWDKPTQINKTKSSKWSNFKDFFKTQLKDVSYEESIANVNASSMGLLYGVDIIGTYVAKYLTYASSNEYTIETAATKVYNESGSILLKSVWKTSGAVAGETIGKACFGKFGGTVGKAAGSVVGNFLGNVSVDYISNIGTEEQNDEAWCAAAGVATAIGAVACGIAAVAILSTGGLAVVGGAAIVCAAKVAAAVVIGAGIGTTFVGACKAVSAWWPPWK